jgi:hypothetical protein
MMNTSDTLNGVLRVRKCPLRAVLGHDCHQSSSSTYRSRRTRSLAFHVRALHRGHRVGGASDRNSYSHFSQCQAATSTLLMARFVPYRREGKPLWGVGTASNCFPARRVVRSCPRGGNVPDGWTGFGVSRITNFEKTRTEKQTIAFLRTPKIPRRLACRFAGHNHVRAGQILVQQMRSRAAGP